MAIDYIENEDETYRTLAKKYNIAISTVEKYFNKILPLISKDLQTLVKEKAKMNVIKNQLRFVGLLPPKQ